MNYFYKVLLEKVLIEHLKPDIINSWNLYKVNKNDEFKKIHSELTHD